MTSAASATTRPAPLTSCRPLPWSANHGTLPFQVRQTGTTFEHRSPAAQLIGALVVPALFGAVCGVVLGSSATVYWALQGAGAIGGVLGGMEHASAAEGADRGLLGGLVFGSFLLLAHAIDGREAQASLGEWPGLLLVFTSIAGCLLGALGGAISSGRASRAERQDAPDHFDKVRA